MSGLNGLSAINYKGSSADIDNIKTQVSTIGIATIGTLNVTNINNPKLTCLISKFNSMFIHSDVSGCVVNDLSPYFKQLICQTVNECPYYCNDCSGTPYEIVRGLANNFNSSDNSNSFFREEIMNDDDNDDDDNDDDDISIMESNNSYESRKFATYSKFISKNLSTNENLKNNNLIIISLDKISKGKWIFNGNISVEIPSLTSISNIKLFVYLDENVVSSGEIDLGSHSQTNSSTIKSHPFNLMFNNDLEGKELKIGIISFNNENENEIKLLETTNFFANKM
jgi:hypothetical protein